MLYTLYVQNGKTIKGLLRASGAMYYRTLANNSTEQVGRKQQWPTKVGKERKLLPGVVKEKQNAQTEPKVSHTRTLWELGELLTGHLLSEF